MTSHDATRIERAMREVRVRFARDSEGSCVAQMVHSSHEGVPNVGWSKVFPSWIVAEKDDDLIGCVQVCYGVPIGRLEFLSFLPNLAFRTRALAVRAMLGLGSLSLMNAGATAIAGTVGFDQRSFREILKQNGCKIATSGNVFVRAA